MTESEERAAFEEWCKVNEPPWPLDKDCSGDYVWSPAARAYRVWKAARAALSAPPGYKLVPIFATEEMIDATYHGQPVADIWHDMVNAAPSPQEPQT